MHGTVEKTIEAIERTLAWRRDRNVYDVDAFAKEIEDEVSRRLRGCEGQRSGTLQRDHRPSSEAQRGSLSSLIPQY